MGKRKKSNIVKLILKPSKQVLIPNMWAMLLGTIDGIMVDTNHIRVEIQPKQGVKLFVGDDYLSSAPLCINYPQVYKVDLLAAVQAEVVGVTDMVHVLSGYEGAILVDNT